MIDFGAMWDDQCTGTPSTGSTPATTASQAQSTFCRCTAEIIASGKSFVDSQDPLNECMNEALGNTKEHWMKIAEHYRREFKNIGKYAEHKYEQYGDKYNTQSGSESESESGSHSGSGSGSSAQSDSSDSVETTTTE